MKSNLLELFGTHIFSDEVMKERVPLEEYNAFHDASAPFGMIPFLISSLFFTL